MSALSSSSGRDCATPSSTVTRGRLAGFGGAEVDRPAEAVVAFQKVYGLERTGALTEAALAGPIERVRVLRDMDTWDDALAIARDIPISRLATVIAQFAEAPA